MASLDWIVTISNAGTLMLAFHTADRNVDDPGDISLANPFYLGSHLKGIVKAIRQYGNNI